MRLSIQFHIISPEMLGSLKMPWCGRLFYLMMKEHKKMSMR